MKFVYSKAKHGTDFTKVWMPIVSGSSSEIRVVVRTGKVRNPAELEKCRAQTSLQGLFINAPDSLPLEHADQLHKSDPGMDFTQCLGVSGNKVGPVGNRQVNHLPHLVSAASYCG